VSFLGVSFSACFFLTLFSEVTMIEYILLGVLAPVFMNLMHMCVGIYVTVARGSVMGLGFSGISFLTKSVGMLFLVWLGIEKLGMDYQIFVPLICFFWFFTHIVEAFVIQHYIQKNVPKQLQDLQI
tara:strand:- start:95 stop:472 length:378 start_codon:yes stop_codon:yes gene_type:complete